MHATNWGKAGDPIPCVDVEDLKTAWRIIGELQRHGIETEKMTLADHFGIDWTAYKSRFKGNDLAAISFRVLLLGLSSVRTDPKLIKKGWFSVEPSEAVFKTTATFPMVWPGEDDRWLPFNVNEFLRQCKAA